MEFPGFRTEEAPAPAPVGSAMDGSFDCQDTADGGSSLSMHHLFRLIQIFPHILCLAWSLDFLPTVPTVLHKVPLNSFNPTTLAPQLMLGLLSLETDLDK